MDLDESLEICKPLNITFIALIGTPDSRFSLVNSSSIHRRGHNTGNEFTIRITRPKTLRRF